MADNSSPLDSVKELLDLRPAAALGLPGIVTALALAFLFWPPRPIDIIPVVALRTSPGAAPTNISREFDSSVSPIQTVFDHDPQKPANCVVREYRLGEISELPPDKALLQSLQLELETEDKNLAACIEAESRFQGSESSVVLQIQKNMDLLEKARSAAFNDAIQFDKDHSVLVTEAQTRVNDLAEQIERQRNLLAQDEQTIRDRDFRIARLGRFRSVIAERLADPRRLRPEKAFDEYLAGLSNHLTAFIVLAITSGIFIKALAPTAIAASYVTLFEEVRSAVRK